MENSVNGSRHCQQLVSQPFRFTPSGHYCEVVVRRLIAAGPGMIATPGAGR